MRYLDKEYKIGKPRCNLINNTMDRGAAMILSDDIVMDFDEFASIVGADVHEIYSTWKRVYDKMRTVQFNLLYMICYGRIACEPMIVLPLVEKIFDDEMLYQMIQEMDEIS